MENNISQSNIRHLDLMSFHPLVSILFRESKRNPKERRLLLVHFTLCVQVISFMLLSEDKWFMFMPISWIMNYTIGWLYRWTLFRGNPSIVLEKCVDIGLFILSYIISLVIVIIFSTTEFKLLDLIVFSLLDFLLFDWVIVLFLFVFPSSLCLFKVRGFYVP